MGAKTCYSGDNRMVPGKTNSRYMILIGITVAAALIVIIQLAVIMLGGQRGRGTSAGQTIEARGTIFDRNGRILAVQTDRPILSAWLPSVRNPAELAARLAPILVRPESQLYELLSQGSGYLIIDRNLQPGQAEAITLLLQQGELPGLTLEEGRRRVYPEQSMAAQIIGFTGIENHGLEGIELTQDGVLAGSDGKPGNQIYLTLDSEIQHEMDRLARVAFETHQAESVLIMVSSAKTGEILAWSTMPTFDPNDLATSTARQRHNFAVQTIYEPGSVFKIYSIASIMNLRGIDRNTLFRTGFGYSPEGVDPPITDLNNYGNIYTEGIIQYSSNVGAALASDTVTATDFATMLRRFGFGERTGISLNGEQSGILRDPSNWTRRSKPTIAIGQEIGVTAIQMIAAASVFGNKGVLLKPQIVKRIVAPSGEVIKEAEPQPLRQVLDPEIARQMLEFMGTAADVGTGQRSRIEGLNISIKTGTAQAIDPVTGGYSRERFVASSLALFPTEDPELIIYVVIDFPKGETYGGRIAAPIIRDAASFIIPFYGITRSQDIVINQSQFLTIKDPQLPELGATVPDYRGLSLRTVLPLLVEPRLGARIEGDAGWVLSQDPPPGTPLSDGMQLVLRMSPNPEDFLD